MPLPSPDTILGSGKRVWGKNSQIFLSLWNVYSKVNKDGRSNGIRTITGEGQDPRRLAAAAAAAKSLQSCLTLCDPIDGSPTGSPSLGFSRQEHWSGLPFPSPMHESEK